jgi:hypothetical protein
MPKTIVGTLFAAALALCPAPAVAAHDWLDPDHAIARERERSWQQIETDQRARRQYQDDFLRDARTRELEYQQRDLDNRLYELERRGPRR